MLLYFFYFYFLNLGCVGSSVLRGLFSGCREWGPLSGCGLRLLIAVASCCGAQVLGSRASVAVERGLSRCDSQAPEHSLSRGGARA